MLNKVTLSANQKQIGVICSYLRRRFLKSEHRTDKMNRIIKQLNNETEKRT